MIKNIRCFVLFCVSTFVVFLGTSRAEIVFRIEKSVDNASIDVEGLKRLERQEENADNELINGKAKIDWVTIEEVVQVLATVKNGKGKVVFYSASIPLESEEIQPFRKRIAHVLLALEFSFEGKFMRGFSVPVEFGGMYPCKQLMAIGLERIGGLEWVRPAGDVVGKGFAYKVDGVLDDFEISVGE